MLISRVQAFALQRGTVYDLIVGRHLLPDIQFGVRKNAVFGGNVLDAVVHLLEIAAAGQIARGGEVAALVDPHIPPIGFKIEVVCPRCGLKMKMTDKKMLKFISNKCTCSRCLKTIKTGRYIFDWEKVDFVFNE